MISFTHEIDILQYLFGPVVRIRADQAISRRSQPDDADTAEEGFDMVLRSASSVVGTFVISFVLSFLISGIVPSLHSIERGTGQRSLIACPRLRIKPNLRHTGDFELSQHDDVGV